MSDYRVPDLPSDEELGITEEDREAHGDEVARKRQQRPERASASGDRARGPLTLLFLIALALLSSTRTGQIAPGRADMPDSAFSSARAMAVLTEVARAPHPTGSPEHTRVRETLMDRLRALDIVPEIQTATALLDAAALDLERPSAVRAATVRNVVGRIPGSDPTGAVLITAHYDSRGIAVGAGDDGSGVVTVLEAVRAVRAGPPLRNDVIVLFTDAEELGLLGMRAFIDEHPWMRDVDLALSFEMRGGGGPSIMFETKDDNGWVVRALADFDPRPLATSLSDEVYRRLPRRTDFTPLKEAGVQGLNFAAIDNAHVYHQVYDSPQNLSESTVQHHGIRALAALRHFGDADLTVVDEPSVVYFSVPGLGLVVYGRVWVLPISALLVLGFVGVASISRRRGARAGHVLGAVGLTAGVALVAYALADATFSWLTLRHPEYGALEGSAFHSEGWYVLAIAWVAIGLLSASSGAVRRWITPVELALGALVLPLLLAVVMSFVVPFGAMTLQWPVAACLLSLTLVSLLGSRRAGAVGWIAAATLAVPVFLMLQPVVELLWLAMSLEIAGVLAVATVVGFALCLPLLLHLESPNRWWAPASALVLGGITLATGLASSRPSPDRPAPSTLLYAYEHGADSAFWVTRGSDRPSRSVTPAGEGDGAELAVAVSPWAQERAGAAFTTLRDMRPFLHGSGPVPVAPARVVRADPPAVEVVGDTVFAGRRRAVLAVRSRVGAERVVFEVEGDTRATAINGKILGDAERLRYVEHWGVPDGEILLEVAMPAGGAIEVQVVEHLLRPEELLGAGTFRRPPELAANVVAQSDRALFRYSVAAFVDPRRASSIPSDSLSAVVTPPPNRGIPGELLELRDSVEPPPDTSGITARSTGEAVGRPPWPEGW